jgi:hypothetical protein
MKVPPPKTVPSAISKCPWRAATTPTATFSASRPEKMPAMTKGATRIRAASPTMPSSSRSVDQITISTPRTKAPIPRTAFRAATP